MYPVVEHILAETRRLRSGPMVTDPVTQHPVRVTLESAMARDAGRRMGAAELAKIRKVLGQLSLELATRRPASRRIPPSTT